MFDTMATGDDDTDRRRPTKTDNNNEDGNGATGIEVDNDGNDDNCGKG